jgi:uncharacterized protein (TIGR02266 family)
VSWEGKADRRQHERVAARIEVRFQHTAEAARALRAYSLNFSAGGLCLKTQRKYALGDVLRLSISVEDREFALSGVVAWVRPGAIGVRFDKLSDADRAGLTELLSSLKR